MSEPSAHLLQITIPAMNLLWTQYWTSYRDLFLQAGCCLEGPISEQGQVWYQILFPEGTTRQPSPGSNRSQLLLPGGLELEEERMEGGYSFLQVTGRAQ